MTLRAANPVNGLIVTPTTGTLTIANGKTLTDNNSLTFAGTDGTTMMFPTTSASIARTDAAQTFTGNQTIPATICTANLGTVGSGSTVVEYGDGYSHTSVITVNTTLPNIPGGASLGLGKLLYTFPSNAHALWVSYMSMAITQTTGHINANTPNVGLGTVIASGAISVLSGTATFQDIISGTNAANCTGTATVNALAPTAGAPFIKLSGGTHTVFFNAAAAWAASGDPAALLTGTVVLNWNFLN